MIPDPTCLFEMESEEYRILKDDSKNRHIEDVVIPWHTSVSEAITALAPMMVMLPTKCLGVLATETRGRDDAKLVVVYLYLWAEVGPLMLDADPRRHISRNAHSLA